MVKNVFHSFPVDNYKPKKVIHNIKENIYKNSECGFYQTPLVVNQSLSFLICVPGKFTPSECLVNVRFTALLKEMYIYYCYLKSIHREDSLAVNAWSESDSLLFNYSPTCALFVIMHIFAIVKQVQLQ